MVGLLERAAYLKKKQNFNSKTEKNTKYTIHSIFVMGHMTYGEQMVNQGTI